MFCSAAEGARTEYRAAAEELGRALADRGIGLIYGGAKAGLMGAVADATLAAGGHVLGVIPHVLVDLEVAHNGVSELHVTDTMHTRKALMAELRERLPSVAPAASAPLKNCSRCVGLANAEAALEARGSAERGRLLRWPARVSGYRGEREGMLRGNRHVLQVAHTVPEALGQAGF